jgi:peptide/nickel transport system ATP-binding protein
MIDASLRASILNLFLDLKKKYEMSFLYITHDLSTASYISGNIIIFYLGGVMEQGSIDNILSKPAHPYTQLLVKCVPVPDPDRKWQERTDLRVSEDMRKMESYSGCKFSNRCPQVMKKCKEVKPQLTNLQQNHQVACYLYSTET